MGAPAESIQRDKSVALWFEGGQLRVRAHLRDHFRDPDGSEMTLHEYRLDLFVDEQTMEVVDVAIEALSLPYAECHAAPANGDRLVGLKLGSGFTAKALARLEGEAGCTHLNSLIADLSIAGLFQGYIGVRRHERAHGRLPEIPASDGRTGICAGWRAGGALATWMEGGEGIAPSPIYPTSLGSESD